MVWTFPDPVPLHREPLYTPRRDLVTDDPTYEDRRFYRVPTLHASIQARDFSHDHPIVLTSRPGSASMRGCRPSCSRTRKCSRSPARPIGTI